jgi:hypothetical protein
MIGMTARAARTPSGVMVHRRSDIGAEARLASVNQRPAPQVGALRGS